MSLLLCFCCVAILGMTGWGFQSVVAELERLCLQPADAVSRKCKVDAFIWSDRVPSALRRRYIVTQARAVPALLCLAALVWLNEKRHGVRVLGVVAFVSVPLSWLPLWLGTLRAAEPRHHGLATLRSW